MCRCGKGARCYSEQDRASGAAMSKDSKNSRGVKNKQFEKCESGEEG